MSVRPFDPRLYLVTDSALAAVRPLEDLVAAAIAGGVTLVQVREKHATTRDFVECTRAIRRRAAAAGVPVIVNDRLDVALATGADGLHVGVDDLAVADARRLLGPTAIIGATVSDPRGARQAREGGADYVACNAAFGTATKTDTGPPIGLAGLRELVAAVDLPVVAIGGIHVGNAAAVLATGVAGVAVVSAIVSSNDPQAAASRLIAILRPRSG